MVDLFPIDVPPELVARLVVGDPVEVWLARRGRHREFVKDAEVGGAVQVSRRSSIYTGKEDAAVDGRQLVVRGEEIDRRPCLEVEKVDRDDPVIEVARMTVMHSGLNGEFEGDLAVLRRGEATCREIDVLGLVEDLKF